MQTKAQVIQTNRLELKSYDDRDMEQAIELLTNEEIKKTFMLPDFESKEQAEKMFSRIKDYSISDSHFEYGIYLQGKLIGFLNDVEIDNGTIEIGYVIHPNYKNHGYATEALAASIDELFRIGYSRVQTGYFAENIASKRVMEKCGMVKISKTIEIEYRGKVHHCHYFETRKE